MNQIKILSYNIHKGFGPFHKKLTIEDIKQFIIDSDADIVCLQEVIGDNISHAKNHRKWPNQRQYEFLADSIWKYYSYAQNAIYPNGDHGNLILSKFPITKWSNTNISTNSFESRGVLYTKINVIKKEKSKNLHLYCTHLDLLEIGRKKQRLLIHDIIKPSLLTGEPIILAGDFNDWNLKTHQFLINKIHFKEVNCKKQASPPATFPSFFPLLALDRIYFKNLHCPSRKKINKKNFAHLSDHLPVWGSFHL